MRLTKQEKNERMKEAYNCIGKEVIRLMQNPNELKALMEKYGTGYTRYSLRNNIIANYQMRTRYGRPSDLLMGYNQWQEFKIGDKVYHRNVKRGENCLYIFGPSPKNYKKIKEVNEETGEEEEKILEATYKRYVPMRVFDITQTEGDEIVLDKNDLYSSKNELKIQYFIDKINVPVYFNDMVNKKGYTDGRIIEISKNIDELEQICVLFHELGHYMLHYNMDRPLSKQTKEMEAEAVAFMVASALGIENKESKLYISSWVKDNEHFYDEFSKRSDKLIKTAIDIIDLFNN